MNARFLPVLLLCLLPACGGSSDPRELATAGSTALNSGDYADAAASYRKALEAIGGDENHPEWMRSKLGLIQAQAYLNGAEAKDEFLALAEARPDKVSDQQFSLIGSKLGDAGNLEDAIAVLGKGMQMHPESPHLKALMDDLGKKAEQSGAGGALDALKGLGYVGGD